jgi:hypothetical protein
MMFPCQFFPGWNSVEAVVKWHRGFEVAGFVALGLLLLFEVQAYVYGNRKDVLLLAQQTSIAAERRKEQEAQLAPRRLSKEQEDKISSYLASQPKGKFVIKATASAQDARSYADQIADLFSWNLLF